MAILVKICCLLLRATAVRISGLLAPGHEDFEREEDQDFDDSKEAERPAGNQALPTVSNPGARGGCVNYGGGSQEAKDAREKSASRRREQQRARETARTYQRPTLEESDRFHTALLTPLGAPMPKDLPEADPVPTGLHSKAHLASQ